MSHENRHVLALAAAACSLSAVAVDPIIEVAEPASADVVYADAFPFVQPISFTLRADTRIGHGTGRVPAELKDITVLDVQVDGATIVNGGRRVGSPFTNVNACAASLLASSTSCVASDARSASISVPWQVVAPGRYTIRVSVKIRSAEGADEEVVLEEVLNAEYPAPPDVANAYIEAHPDVLASRQQHGCVVSRVADEQAESETFGPDGGPYDNDLIEGYVTSFAGTCPRG